MEFLSWRIISGSAFYRSMNKVVNVDSLYLFRCWLQVVDIHWLSGDQRNDAVRIA